MPLATKPDRVLLLHNHDNTWTAADLIEVAEENRILMNGLRANGYQVADLKVHDSVARAFKGTGYTPDQWLIFNWCEGYADRPWDYDGVAEELEQLHFTYTGSGPWALRVSRDKSQVRQVLTQAGVGQPIGAVAHTPDNLAWTIYPAIVKPVNQHGSYGIDRAALVEDEQQLRERVEYVRDLFQAPALIEEYIDGPEYHVTVLGNSPPEVLPEVQVEYSNFANWRDRIYTYEAKFDLRSTALQQIRFLCPAMLEVSTHQAIQRAALRAYAALRCRDYARIDLRLRAGRPYIIDINPNADINSESMVLMAIEAAGLNYNDMVGQLVGFAAERWRPESALATVPWAADLHRNWVDS